MKKNTDDPWRMVGLVGTLGFEIVACIIGGIYFGRYLDETFDAEPLWLAVCAIAGLAVGIVSAYYTLKTFVKD